MFQQWQNRRAAKRYASVLPVWLQRNYGAGEDGADFYTIPQIRKGIRALKLNPKYVALAYAAYLPETEYNALKDELPRPMEFGEARALFVDHQAVTLQSRHSQPRKRR